MQCYQFRPDVFQIQYEIKATFFSRLVLCNNFVLGGEDL